MVNCRRLKFLYWDSTLNQHSTLDQEYQKEKSQKWSCHPTIEEEVEHQFPYQGFLYLVNRFPTIQFADSLRDNFSSRFLQTHGVELNQFGIFWMIEIMKTRESVSEAGWQNLQVLQWFVFFFFVFFKSFYHKQGNARGCERKDKGKHY